MDHFGAFFEIVGTAEEIKQNKTNILALEGWVDGWMEKPFGGLLIALTWSHFLNIKSSCKK